MRACTGCISATKFRQKSASNRYQEGDYNLIYVGQRNTQYRNWKDEKLKIIGRKNDTKACYCSIFKYQIERFGNKFAYFQKFGEQTFVR